MPSSMLTRSQQYMDKYSIMSAYNGLIDSLFVSQFLFFLFVCAFSMAVRPFGRFIAVETRSLSVVVHALSRCPCRRHNCRGIFACCFGVIPFLSGYLQNTTTICILSISLLLEKNLWFSFLVAIFWLWSASYILPWFEWMKIQMHMGHRRAST